MISGLGDHEQVFDVGQHLLLEEYGDSDIPIQYAHSSGELEGNEGLGVYR